jgi:hypothetical protein
LKTTFLASLILLFLIDVATSQNTFQKSYGDPINHNYGKSVLQTKDGGYIVLGTSGGAYPGIDLIKTDTHGDTLWTRIYTAGKWSDSYSVALTNDGGYMIVGNIHPEGYEQSTSMYLIKTDSNGYLGWAKSYGKYGYNWGGFVQQTWDSGYIVCGAIEGDKPNNESTSLIKLDKTGNFLWSKFYGCAYAEEAFCVRQTWDGGYIICGEYSSDELMKVAGCLIKTKWNGDTLWAEAISYSNTYFSSVQQTSDGGYITVGVIFPYTTDNSDILLVKVDSYGQTLWIKSYGGGGDDYGDWVQQTYDGGYIIVGGTESYEHGKRHIYLIKTNDKGDTLWTKTYQGSDYFCSTVQQTSDGGYIINGISDNTNGGIYIIKTDSYGNSGCNEMHTSASVSTPEILTWWLWNHSNDGGDGFIYPDVHITSGGTVNTMCSQIGINEINKEDKIISVYPNPANNAFTVTLNSVIKSSELVLHNYLGKEILRRNFTGNAIELTNLLLENGVYLVRVQNNENQYLTKLIIEHE